MEGTNRDVTAWRKSSYSGTETACVEVAHRDGTPFIGIRDSKNPTAAHLTITPTALRHLLITASR